MFPLGAHLSEVPRLAEAEVNICMYREFGRALYRVTGVRPVDPEFEKRFGVKQLTISLD